jgi:uncharacterized protein YegL
MGAAVDYSLANASRTALQASLDNTGLMLAKMMPLSDADLNTRGWQIFQGNLGSSPLVFHQADLVITQSTSTLQLDINTTYNTQLASVLRLVGANTMFPVGAHTQVSWGNSRLRVALVLDNTGSMASANKMTALKNALNTATTGLIDALRLAAVNNGDVYVSIVPFVKDVKVGSSNYSANWIYWDDAAHQDNTSWDANNGHCSDNSSTDRDSCLAPGNCSLAGYTDQTSCQAATGSCNNSRYTSQSTCIANGYCSISSKHTQNGCNNAGGTWRTPATWTPGGPGVWTDTYAWTPNNHNTWNGCIVDRGDPDTPNANNYDTNIVAPTTTNTATQYAAEQYGSCPQAVMGLNYNWTNMKTLVNNMSPAGNTNQAIGLQLGWMSLTGGGPFAMPAEDPNYTYQHVIILLTDGLNTQDRWYTSQSSIDARQALTCTNAKAAGITLYTIQVNTDGEATSTLLRNCASDSTKFFLLTSSTQIVTTFAQIGTNLAKLHIAR